MKITKFIIIKTILVFIINNNYSYSQVKTTESSCWKFGLKNLYGTTNGLYQNSFNKFPKDGGSALKLDLALSGIGFNNGTYFEVYANFADFSGFLFTPRKVPLFKNFQTSYRLNNLSDSIGKGNAGYDDAIAHHGEVLNFKYCINKKSGLMYGAYWNFNNIGTRQYGKFKTKSIFGLNIGYSKNIKKFTWITTFGIGRDLVVYRDAGKVPGGLLIDGEEYLIKGNYNVNTTLYFVKQKGAYFGVIYDYIKGTTDSDTKPFDMSKIELKFGIYFIKK